MTIDKIELDRAQVVSTVAAVAAVALIALGCIYVVKPFLPALLLAVIFSLSAWPAYVWLRERLGGRETLAAAIMTVALGACFLIPLLFLGSSLAENFTRASQFVMQIIGQDKDDLGRMLREIPWAGQYIYDFWSESAASTKGIVSTAGDIAAPVSQVLIKVGASVGQGVIDLSLGVIIAFFFFRHGGSVARRVRNISVKFAGARAKHLLSVSKNTMVSVVYGVLGTALVQGALAGLGFWIAGVPGATFWGFATFILSIFPAGPPLIWVPAVIWLFMQDQTTMAVFLAVWGLFAISGVDNFVRPYFIALGTDLPLLLVLMGVVGGIIAFGFIGVFIGPTLLAVGYALITEWSRESA